jgi:hypothetical protein
MTNELILSLKKSANNKMKTLWHILLTSIAVLLTTQLTGQVTIQAALTPPYSPHFSDYENQMILGLTNTSAQVVQIKLIGEITNQDDGNYVKTAPQYLPSQPIILQPNEIKTIFANQSHTGFLDKNNIETSYGVVEKATILASGQIPEGVYDFCIQALDYTTGAPLSQPNCQVISIGYPAPPTPILPSCNTDVADILPMFMWLPPVGNFPNAMLRYDFMLVKVPDGTDPNDALLFAISSGNTQDFWQINDIPTSNYNYKPSDAPLVHNQNYAWAVRVKDLNNSVNFQNQGLSQVCMFTWKDPNIQYDGLHLPPLGTACQNDCAIDVLGEVEPKPVVALNDIVKMGDFDMKIINFTVNSDREYDRLSGMAMINVPFLNGKLARLRVQFDTIVLSTDRRVLSGTAKGINNAGLATLIPNFNDPTWTGQTLSQTGLTTIDDYFKNLYANGENAVETIVNTVGWEMPMGIRKNGYTVAVTQINFAPNYARMNAMVVVPLPNYTPSVSALGLGVGDLCMTKDKFCKEGKVFLQQDFSIDVDAQNPGNELIFKASTADSKDLTGSYMLFDKDGIKHVHIDARYDLPKSKVVRADGSPLPVQAQLTLRADKILDLMFMAQVDSFKIKGNNDFTFQADSMYVDLSDKINPTLPDTITFMDINSDLAWHGFYAQKMNVSFAHGLTGKPTKIEVKDLIIDKNGVTANIFALNIIDINQGKMGSFNFTLDTIQVNIFQNSFMYGKIAGAMRINIAAADFNAGFIDFTPKTRNNLIPYTALLSYKPVLDPLPDGSYPPSKLVFDFVVRSARTIDIPIWAATLDLLPTTVIQVSNQTGKFVANANLTGTFGFSAKIIAGIGAINCAGLKFQNWGISSDNPHFTNDPTFTLASPQKSIAGFPISLNTFKFVTQANPNGGLPLYGLQFGINVKLADSIGEMPAASGKFSVFGRLDMKNGQMQPAFDHAEVNQICVSGKIAVVKLAGCVDFYSNDPKFGDGFRGQLAMELPGDIKVGATAQFGSVKNFRYWYADAIASPPAGSIQIFAGLELAGFGGGAYYHMKPKALPNMTVGVAGQNATGVGMTPTGVVYEPDSTLDFGMKAKVYVASLKKRDVFNADAMLTIEFQNGTLGLIKVDGNARFISDKDMKGGAVTGSLSAGFDNSNGKGLFYANANLNASLANGLIKGEGSFDVHLEKGSESSNQLRWHLRFGRAPGSGTPINLNLVGLAKVETYFQAGNFQIDPMPSPPDLVADMFTTPAAKAMMTNQRGQISPNPDAVNIIHGGRFEAGVDKEFLIFYGALEAGFGYDMMLMNNPAGCEGYPNPGIYGWYAKGQAYAGLKGEIGLVVSMFGTKARYSIAEIHGAALVNAGFVNPTWAEGALTGGYKLFDGLISGSYNYEFAVGDKCKEMNVNGLDKIDIIADVLPAASNNVEVSAAPSVSTSIPMNKNKIIDLVQKYNDGTSKHRLFRFDETLIKTEVKRNGVLMPVDSFERITSQDDYSFTLLPKKTLLKQTPYTFKVTVNIQECKAANVSYNAGNKLYQCNGGDAGWELAKKDGQVWKEERTVNFKTDNGLKSIQDGMVEYTTPYQMSRMHLQTEGGTPKIVLSQTFEPLSYQFPANAVITYEARFIPLSNNSPMVKVNVPNIQGKKDITFNYPTTLSKGTYYAIQLIAKWTKAAGAPSPNPKDNFTDLKQKTAMNYNNALYATVNARLLNENKLAAVSSSEMKLYEIRFRTSQYNDYSNKLDNTVSEKVKYNVKKLASSNPQSVWVNEVNLSTSAKIAAAINTALGMPVAHKPTIRYTEEIRQRGPERFDFYDLNPYKKTMPSGQNIYRAPKVVYNTSDVKAFHDKLNNKLVKILQITNLAKKDYDMMEGENGDYNHSITGSPTIKLTWEEALTQNVPIHVPSFAGPDDFLSSENANTTVGSMMNGYNLIRFKSNWLEMADDTAPNPHIYGNNFMNQNGYQPNAASDYEKMGQAMDAVDEEINALETDNLTPKPTVKSAASKAATGGSK